MDASLIRADANKQNATPIGEWPAEKLDEEDAPGAVREYLDTLDDAAFGAATEKTPKFTSHADPAARWTGDGWLFQRNRLEADLHNRFRVICSANLRSCHSHRKMLSL